MTIRIRVGDELTLGNKKIPGTAEMVEAYREQVQKFGFTAKGLFYPDEELHSAKITQYATLAHRLWHGRPSVLDAGCGYGSLLPFLPPCTYTGIDVVPELVDEARRRYPGQHFEVRDIYMHAEVNDWVLLVGMSGTIPEPESLVAQAWKLTRVGLIVDFIDGDRYSGTLNRYDMGSCLRFLVALGCSRIETLAAHGYTWAIMIAWKEGIWQFG